MVERPLTDAEIRAGIRGLLARYDRNPEGLSSEERAIAIGIRRFSRELARDVLPELPDFDQIARRVADETGVGRLEEWDNGDPARVIAAIAEQLRLVWNARGLADVQLFAGELDDRDIRERIATLDR